MRDIEGNRVGKILIHGVPLSSASFRLPGRSKLS
jgi:hypothetical protein